MLLLIFYAALLIGILVAAFYVLTPVLQMVVAAFLNAGYSVIAQQSDVMTQVPEEPRNVILETQNMSLNTLVFQYQVLSLLVQHAWILILIIFIVTLFVIARRISQTESGGFGGFGGW